MNPFKDGTSIFKFCEASAIYKEFVKARRIYMYADYVFSNYSSFSTEANLAFNLTFLFGTADW